MQEYKVKAYKVDSYIDNQKIFTNTPYGTKGTVADNGCAAVACYNLLKYLGYKVPFSKVYTFFNDNMRLNFKGLWGTNPFSVEKYLKKVFKLKVNMHFFRVPKKPLKSCIVLYFYKHKGKLSAHYIFGYTTKEKFITYNLNHSYPSIENMLKKENIWKKMFVMYEIFE